MSIQEIILILENKLTSLEKLKISAQEVGDLAEVIRLQADIEETTISLYKLRETLWTKT